jgi:hypothetical protein
LTGFFILLFIVKPQILEILPFSTYLPSGFFILAHYETLGMLMGGLALQTFWINKQVFNRHRQKIMAVFIMLACFILVAPYLFAVTFRPGYDQYTSISQIKNAEFLNFANDFYLRIPPNFNDPSINIAPFDPEDSLILAGARNPSDNLFYIHHPKDYPNSVDLSEFNLDVLYYPELMDIEILDEPEDNKPIMSTYWRTREGLGYSGGPGIFHGLHLTNVRPGSSFYMRIKFVGSVVGNWISLSTLMAIIWICIGLNCSRKSRLKRFNPAKIQIIH